MGTKRFVYSMAYMAGIIWLMTEGLKYMHVIYITAQERMVLYPYFLYSTIFPIVIGLLLGVGLYSARRQEKGQWKIDWIKLTACGIPLLYVTLLPTFSFLFQRVSWPFTGYLISFGQDKLPMLTGLIFGYIIVDSVRKESAD